MTPVFGGSFAPPLTDAKLADYKALADALPVSPVRDAMERLLACCHAWWELPESAGTPSIPHAGGTGTVVLLSPGNRQAMFDHIPWAAELDLFATLFEGIDNTTQKPLRDAAHHLLWHAREFDLDREPLTSDKL